MLPLHARRLHTLLPNAGHAPRSPCTEGPGRARGAEQRWAPPSSWACPEEGTAGTGKCFFPHSLVMRVLVGSFPPFLPSLSQEPFSPKAAPFPEQAQAAAVTPRSPSPCPPPAAGGDRAGTDRKVKGRAAEVGATQQHPHSGDGNPIGSHRCSARRGKAGTGRGLRGRRQPSHAEPCSGRGDTTRGEGTQIWVIWEARSPAWVFSPS